MDYEKHLLKLIQKRNVRELNFKTVIDSHSELWNKNKSLQGENNMLQRELESLKESLIKIDNLYNININQGDLIINDNYFSSTY